LRRQDTYDLTMGGALNLAGGSPVAGARKDQAPLSFCQQRLWLLDQLDLRRYSQNVSGVLRLKGSLDGAALRSTLNEIVARHEILRTRFVAMTGHPVQIVRPEATVDLKTEDLSRTPGSHERELERMLADASGSPFDSRSSSLLRVLLVKLDEEEHALVVAMHPLAADGESMKVFVREAAALYGAFSSRKPSRLTAPPQYSDFAVWERGHWRGEFLERHVAYWKRKLAGLSPFEILADHPRPVVQNFRPARESIELPSSLSLSLEALSRRERAPFDVLLLAAFKTLLYRYTSQHDLVVGTPRSGRHRPEFRQSIGPFANYVVLRTDLSGEPTFRDALDRVRKTIAEVAAYEELRFEKLLEALQTERDPSRHPLFQILFAFQDHPTPAETMGVLQMWLAEWDHPAPNVELAFSVDRKPSRLTASVRYDAHLFDATTIGRMLVHFETLLEGIVANPGSPLSELPMLAPKERRRLVVERNATRKEYPRRQRIHDLFEAQVERTPDRVAVVFEDVELTYRELNHRANQLARYLRRQGVGPGVFTAIYMGRCLEMVVGLLGVLKAGGAYVPLDPAYPAERVSFMLEDAQIPFAVTHEPLSTRLSRGGMRCVRLDADFEAIARESGENLSDGATADDLAYLIYTSGSTGKPKGVRIPHRSAVNFLYSMREEPGLAAEDVVLAVTTISFDPSVLELFLPLMVGARAVMVSRDVAVDGRRLSERIARSQVTFIQATPATWRLLLDSGWKGSSRLKILCGGEALSRDLAAQLLARSDSLWNVYGPTETTVWSTCHRIAPSEWPIPIGRPIANMEMYILDSHRKPVPDGVPGELYIGGAGVAEGYHNRSELTAEKFIQSPFHPGTRLYRTGDLTRYLASGEIEFLGRIDNQVKIRGFRVELGESEAALSGHPKVRQAVVAAREDLPGERRLAAYIVREGQPVTVAELRSFLKEKLPDYMVPSSFTFLDSLPLTPTGKVDRRALPAPSSYQGDRAADYVPPFYSPEHQLVDIWEEILGVRPIGIRDDFFELGGDSLLAVRMMHEVGRICGRELPVATLFAGATIEDLARKLLEEQSSDPSLVVEVQGGSKRPLFFLHGDINGGGFYCRSLARSLGDRPFYALNTYARRGHAMPRAIETMAAAYIESIRAIQPDGPYLLGGFCNGGAIAYEMARQLERQGSKVDLVMVVAYAAWNTRFRWIRRFVGALGRPLRLDFDEQADLYEVWRGRAHRSAQLLREWRRRWTGSSAGTSSASAAPGGAEEAREPYDPEIARAYDRLDDRHVPGTYHGRVVLFWPDENREEIADDPAAGWDKVAPQIQVEVVSGGHLSCVIAHAEALADRMSAHLDAVEASHEAPAPAAVSSLASRLSLLLFDYPELELLLSVL
jgi:amino acid adenylation domain-containing protein